MEFIYTSKVLQHNTGMHPENAAKLAAFSHLSEQAVPDAAEWLSLAHDPVYIEQVQSACEHGFSIDPDTVTSPKSYDAALAAVGAAVLASERNGFAIIRPPGHHAYANKGTGFCLFNNIAIATKRLINSGKRVLIFDFDGHYGDGTSAIFYDSDQVFFWSIHQFPAFPYKGKSQQIGSGKGLGHNLNVPLPAGSGDDIFMDAFRSFLPRCIDFQPDIVGISAGFDAHKDDPLLELNVTNNSFHAIGKVLGKQFPQLFAVLEGGYNPIALTKGIHSFVAGINQTDNPHPETPTTSSVRNWEIYENDKKFLIPIFGQ